MRSLDASQRRMLRSIVGWVRVSTEPWTDTKRRMWTRVDRAPAVFPLSPWALQLAQRKFNFVTKMLHEPEGWPRKLIRWNPLLTNPHARRRPSRPSRRWDDDCWSFAEVHFPGHSHSWFTVANATGPYPGQVSLNIVYYNMIL